MATSARAARPSSKKTRPAAPRKAAGKTAGKAGAGGKGRSATDTVIATDLAPAVAIALLDKSEKVPGAPAPALDCLAAGAAPSETEGKVRVQLVFENGAVLPVEMSEAAGAALPRGLEAELPKKKGQ